MFRIFVLIAVILVFIQYGCCPRQEGLNDWLSDLPIIRPDAGNGIQNAGWAYDKYPDLPKLDAHKAIVIADINGPAVIKQIHIVRHFPSEIMSRGIVIEIYFENEKTPAVMCPLADFFGHGSNGRSEFFSSTLIEFAPQTYNAYFQMPFKTKAKIVLRNDTDKSFSSYSFVEWEKILQWKPEYGYFHATFKRQCINLTPDSELSLIDLKGKGHIVGRQMSIATDEPMCGLGGTYWCEGNNEIDIDGKSCAVEYLGFEDSFGFSWGWQGIFKGLRQGITCYQELDPDPKVKLVSVYRHHDHKPIRFNKSLQWKVTWKYDCSPSARKEWAQKATQGGFWLDFATVHYWYQDSPAGYEHQLPSLEDRCADLLHSSVPDRQSPVVGTPQKKAVIQTTP